MTEQVLVVGGGVIGCAIARELAPEYDVTVLEKDGIGHGASGRAAGLVTIATAYAGHDRIVDHALESFHAFDGNYGFRFHDAESLEFPSERGPLQQQVEEHREQGVAAEYVPAEDATAQYPMLNVPEGGYLRFDRTGWVVPSEFTEAVRRSATDRGAAFETGVEVTDLAVNGRTVTAVETDVDTREPDRVVLAGGWQSPALVDGLVDLPVRPYWTQCVELGADVDLSDVPMGWLPDPDVYWRPTRSGTLLLGGGSAFPDDPAHAPTDEAAAFRNRIVDLFPHVVDDTSGAHYVQGWAGVDGATPDTYPIIDVPPEGPENLIVATGFHGRGIMSAFTAGAAVRGLLTGESPVPTAPFRLDRFDSRSTDFEFISVSA
ncbi:NAD(P)/FAD-dependent oxidoreductase [Halorarius litoreus]|uniref:NAD(P)/FAD-dependent oxidoreductase n=1 Tax=Halorarius litoreus TaxID=2962676 RepID=UPI0020CE8CC8|nr:FAD-dependent oxidoreductase [Halorarius litoreus]